MSRTLGTNLSADNDAALSAPRYLVDLRDGALRYATGGDINGDNIVYDGNTYLKHDISVQQLEFATALHQAWRLTIRNIAPNLISTVTNFDVETSVKLLQTGAFSSYAGANDVVTLYDGVINGGFSYARGQIVFTIIATMDWFPLWTCVSRWGFNELMHPGTYNLRADGGRLTITVETE